MDREVSIVVWGVTGSGKTWLVDAFFKRIQLMSERLKEISEISSKKAPSKRETPMRFSFCLRHYDTLQEVRVDEGPGKIGSLHTRIDRYLFTRKKEENGLRYEASSFCHDLILVDPKGSYIPPGEIGAGRPPDAQRTKTTEQLLKTAGFIIAVIDPGTGSKSTASRAHPKDPSEVFLEKLQTLRAVLENNKRDRHIALCFTKSDKFNPFPNINAAIADRFTSNVSDEIYQELNRIHKIRGHKVVAFSMSAAGHWYPGGNKTPNIHDTKQNELASLEDWRPEGVEAPFLWFFDCIEEQRFASDLQVNHNALNCLYCCAGIHNGARRKALVKYETIQKKVATWESNNTAPIKPKGELADVRVNS